ncbi:hypothetical protein [Halomarina litorea]|uniref:hypothetical protein n=1 Tax=Halomarina litorea TaxID=2961595 RepID=UPI0020C30194|nr:hypothetical protein [Halomarina sp. BCD28]
MTNDSHDCPGCDRSFGSRYGLIGHWGHYPSHRDSGTKQQARSRVERYLGGLDAEKKRDALAITIGITAASMLIHVPGVYFRVLETLQINAQPATIVPAAAIIRVIQKHVQSTPLTSKQADEILFAAAVTWLAVEGGHQLAAMVT